MADALFGIWVVAVIGVIVFSLVGGAKGQEKALETQCRNTASTLNSKEFLFDKRDWRCSIITTDGKLVTF